MKALKRYTLIHSAFLDADETATEVAVIDLEQTGQSRIQDLETSSDLPTILMVAGVKVLTFRHATVTGLRTKIMTRGFVQLYPFPFIRVVSMV